MSVYCPIDDFDELLDPNAPYTGAILFLPVLPKRKEETVQQQFVRHAGAFQVDWYAGEVKNPKEHASYLAIIAMGRVVLPFLLQDFLGTSLPWLPALRVLTRQDPGNGSTDREVQRAAWRAWAVQNQIVLKP
ncbi:MAG: hypothetical protein NTX72_04290 [Candidatus Uhrbacteria bacterium]|nr:hypothetical protein [Candidatus Uhrbacteria bacterium]